MSTCTSSYGAMKVYTKVNNRESTIMFVVCSIYVQYHNWMGPWLIFGTALVDTVAELPSLDFCRTQNYNTFFFLFFLRAPTCITWLLQYYWMACTISFFKFPALPSQRFSRGIRILLYYCCSLFFFSPWDELKPPQNVFLTKVEPSGTWNHPRLG